MTTGRIPGKGESPKVTSRLAKPPSSVSPASAELKSLAPSYRADHHETYVAHLDAVVQHAKNRNVALTGRYGTGKSSVIDKFEEKHKGKVLRISITTLGPDRDGEGLTNRIQKELVKQIIYRTKPSQLRSSRFTRTDPITPKRALWQGALAVAVLGLFLGLGGWLPPFSPVPDLTLAPEASGLGPVSAPLLRWGLLFVVATVIAAWLRMAVASRIVTSLSTAGTSITLGERDDTYFDTYLEELVSYFDRGDEDYVIFEDLDRFDDPAIFDSLRELNTILHSSPRRRPRLRQRLKQLLSQRSDKPELVRHLCFIYAIKDSLFEHLGEPEGQQNLDDEQDTGRVATEHATPSISGNRTRSQVEALAERANRTKFFDVVIPMVPFLTHRNARDILDRELAQRDFSTDTVSRALRSLVARHVTDMRLLINIVNEFTVYAQRLLWSANPAPDLTGDHLFALVVYKNFHLADFEAIPVRKSALDELDRAHRLLVRHAVVTRQKDRQQARDSVLFKARQSALADRLGSKLEIAARAILLHPNQPQQFNRLANYRIVDNSYTPESGSTIDFWQAVVRHEEVSIIPRLHGGDAYPSAAVKLDKVILGVLFPEALKEGVWSTELIAEVQRRQDALTKELDFLSGAGYAALLERPEFQDSHSCTFANLLEIHLASDIARELVSGGYINQNFATYSAAFYGSFAGIDAETFYYRAVQPNEMLLDHRFVSDASLGNLLEQLDQDQPDFYRSVSVLNPQIVTYLIQHHQQRARDVAGFIATHFDDSAQEFLSAYLAEDSAPCAELIGLLAEHPWRGLFDHLASAAVPESLRLELVDAALLAAPAVEDFTLNETICAFIAEHYTEMNAFITEGVHLERAEVVREFAIICGVQVQNLAGVAQPLRSLFVVSQTYVLTADNLRAALGLVGPVSLDVVWKNETVATRCLADVDDYLQVVDVDSFTPWAVETPETLLVLLDEDEAWVASHLSSILERSSPESCVEDLLQVPAASWKVLANWRRFALNVSNLTAYIKQHGVDRELAEYLTSDGAVHEGLDWSASDDAGDGDASAEAQRGKLALELLNAHQQLHAVDRAMLAARLGVSPSGLPLAEIEPAPDDLLAEALDRGLLTVSEVFSVAR
ncbi:hypothetical protein [Pseudonocardia alni]|uniref:YobI family P-loop NTPase n=1 Tax=Pseudonocardia alni TaxID=33907 RepID=UPI00279FD526|nr:hypothetical protein PaSha_27215 [Pseudonocardia alni]